MVIRPEIVFNIYIEQQLVESENLIMANVDECSDSSSNGAGDGFPSTKFWIGLFTRDVIALLGIIGNIMILVILRQKDIRNTFNKLRVSLALSDTIMLITCLAELS